MWLIRIGNNKLTTTDDCKSNQAKEKKKGNQLNQIKEKQKFI